MFNRSAYITSRSPLEKDLYKLFKKSESLIILDIGGCEGEDSVKYSRLFPNATIFVFEPLPKNQELIRDNISRYQPNNIELVPIALSDVAGTQAFYVSAGHPGDQGIDLDWDFGNKSSSLLPPDKHLNFVPWVNFDEVIDVTSNTLNNFLEDRRLTDVDFIHMDVQGAELKVLTGAGNRISNVKAIWLEVADVTLYENQPLRTDIEKFMTSNGFLLVRSSMDNGCGDQFYLNNRWFRTFSFFNNFLQFHFRKNSGDVHRIL